MRTTSRSLIRTLHQKEQQVLCVQLSKQSDQWAEDHLLDRMPPQLVAKLKPPDPSGCEIGIVQDFHQDEELGPEPLPRAHVNGRPQTKIESAGNRRSSPLLQNTSQEPSNRQSQHGCKESAQRREKTALSIILHSKNRSRINKQKKHRWRIPESSHRQSADRGNYLASTPSEPQPTTQRNKT